MKKTKILALVLAAIMLSLTLASCGGSPKVSVTCKISVMLDGEYICDHYEYTVEGTEKNPPTVLQAAREALQILEIPFEVDDLGNSFESISYDGVDYKTGLNAAGDTIYAWIYTADGVEPETGRAGVNPVLEGQQIEFTYVGTPLNPQEFSEE